MVDHGFREWNPLVDGCKVNIYFGHTRVANEAATQDGVETDVWWLDNYPVSGKNLKIEGTIGADTNIIVNYVLEPLTGRITMDAALPVYDSISVDYFYYINIEDGIALLTKDFKVHFPRPMSEITIFGQPHYTVHNNYPHKLSFKVVIEREQLRNLLTDPMFRADYFILIDRNIGADNNIRAYEGPLWSEETGSIFKGRSHTVPIELMVQNFGRYDLGGGGIISAFANAGAGITLCTSVNHGLSNGDWITISDTANYDGTYQVFGVTALTSFIISKLFTFNETGTYVRNPEIDWSWWEN